MFCRFIWQTIGSRRKETEKKDRFSGERPRRAEEGATTSCIQCTLFFEGFLGQIFHNNFWSEVFGIETLIRVLKSQIYDFDDQLAVALTNIGSKYFYACPSLRLAWLIV